MTYNVSNADSLYISILIHMPVHIVFTCHSLPQTRAPGTVGALQEGIEGHRETGRR
jgi:hypothetical protein